MDAERTVGERKLRLVDILRDRDFGNGRNGKVDRDDGGDRVSSRPEASERTNQNIVRGTFVEVARDDGNGVLRQIMGTDIPFQISRLQRRK